RISRDHQFRKKLEKILHPEIARVSEERMRHALANHPLVFYSAPVLIESGRSTNFSKVLLVLAPQAIRLQRVCARDKISEHAALALMNVQMPDQEKTKHATYIIENNGTLDELRLKVKQFYESLLKK